jgi:hypothetical protein
MLRTSLVALLLSGFAASALAGELEAGTILICDTEHQAVRVASLLHGDDAVSVVRDINAEEHSPTACGLTDAIFRRGASPVTVRTKDGTFEIVKVLVTGVINKTGVQDVPAQIYFTVNKLDERIA